MFKFIKYLNLILLSLILSYTFSNASSKIVSVESNGYGSTEELAITSALKKAIMQVNGVDIKTQTISKSSKGGIDIKENERTTSIKFQFEDSTSADLKAKGLIDSYQIINSSNNDNEWKIRLKVNVVKFELDKSSDRKRIALLPIESKINNVKLSKKISLELQNEIESNLVQTRKFAVLSRTDIGKVLNEQNFINLDAVNKNEKAKLGNLLGGDVILSVTINSANYNVIEKSNQYISTVSIDYEGSLSINLKVISAVTGEIKFSDTYNSTINHKNKSISDMIKDVSFRAVKSVVYAIYPNRIIKVIGNDVFVNTGGKSLKKNDILAVYKEGEIMIDPYTGESLGSSSVEIAKIKIVRIEPKFSVGKIIEGGNIEINMTVKSVINANKKNDDRNRINNGGESDTQIKKGGGVVLPFD